MVPRLGNVLRERGCGKDQVARLRGAFESLKIAPGDTALFVPGRIELIGKHVDYAGGNSLTVATTRGFCVRARSLAEEVLRIDILDSGLTAELPLEAFVEGDGWVNYPATLVRRILTDIPSARKGAELRMVSDLPLAVGLSSSSAFLVAAFLGWAHATGWILDPLLQGATGTVEDLAAYVASIEGGREFAGFDARGGVGTKGGSQDHTAILCSRAGQIGRYSYLPTRRLESLDWPDGVEPLVLSTCVEAEKTGDALDTYNEASRLASDLVDLWNADGRAVASLGELSEMEVDALGSRVSGRMADRLSAFDTERRLVEAAAVSLRTGDVNAFCDAVNASQEGAERFLGNQIDETSFLCRAAREAGALAATSFGAGFGGAVWALVPCGKSEEVSLGASARYRARFAREAQALVEAAAPGAFFLDGRDLLGRSS